MFLLFSLWFSHPFSSLSCSNRCFLIGFWFRYMTNKMDLPMVINRHICLKYPIIFVLIHSNPLWQCLFCSSFEALRCMYLKTGKRKTASKEKYSCRLIEISACRCCIHLQMLQHEVCQFLHYECFPLSMKEAETMSNLMWLMHVSLPLSLYFQHGSEAFCIVCYYFDCTWSALELLEAVPSVFPDVFSLTFTLYAFTKLLLCLGWLTCITSPYSWSFCYLKRWSDAGR